MNHMKPAFLLAGGRSDNPKSMVPMLAKALGECGRERPAVAYIGAANDDNLLFYESHKLLLKQAGAGKVAIVRLAKDTADAGFARAQLGEADAVFLSGGEVEDGMRRLQRHGLDSYLKELRGQGKLFIGISAGSIMMGAHWVHWDVPEDDATASLFDCLGFAPVTFDTHAEDENWKELVLALKLQGSGARGYGIPRGGMISIDGQGRPAELEKSLLPYVNESGRVRRV